MTKTSTQKSSEDTQAVVGQTGVRSQRSTAIFVVLGVIVVIVVAVVGYFWYGNYSANKKAQQTYEQYQKVDSQEKAAAATEQASKEQVGSDVWVDTMVNNAINFAQNDQCTQARSTLDEVKSVKPGDYSQAEDDVKEFC